MFTELLEFIYIVTTILQVHELLQITDLLTVDLTHKEFIPPTMSHPARGCRVLSCPIIPRLTVAFETGLKM